jgi:L-asparaginase
MRSSILSIVIVAFALGTAPAQTTAPNQPAPRPKVPKAPTGQAQTAGKPNIMILATGGTIAGAGAAGGAAYTAGQFKVEDLIAAVPGLDKMANLKGEQIVNIGSQDMNDAVWLKLANRINEVLPRKDVDAIIVTHGTDTMEETAYFLNLVVKSDKPVILVGSMRPATAISADGPGNLHAAVVAARSPDARGRGVLVVMNDMIHHARDVEKTNTTSVETFKSPDRGPAGIVEGSEVRWFDPTDKKHTTKTEFAVSKNTKLPRVDIIYAHSNMDAKLIEAALQAGAQGLVIAGVGDGNMSKEALDAVTAAAKKGIVVVRSTRLGTGVVLRNAEVKDDETGTVASGEFNPPKSRVLAQLALTAKRHNPADVQRMFNQY